MLTRIWAVLRSIVLIGITAFAIWATPWMPMAKTFDEQYARCAASLTQLQRAIWLAVGWIALEVVVGWVGVWNRGRADRSELKKALREAQSTRPPDPTPPAA